MAPCRAASERQLELLLEFAEGNRTLALGGLGKGPLNRLTAIKKWEDLTRRLNSVGSGCRKSPMQWRRYWTLLKSRTKIKAEQLQQATSGTGGAPNCNNTPLTSMEEHILCVIGKKALKGEPEMKINVTDLSTHSGFEEYSDLNQSQEGQFLNNITETIDVTDSEIAEILPGTDRETPAVTRVVSSPLKRPQPNITKVAPEALRKSFKVLNEQKLGTGQKQQTIDQENRREEQEFQQRIKHRYEMHRQAYRHNEERHAAELRILNLKARLLEIEIEKLNK